MKKVFLYIILLIPWFLSSLFNQCTSYFDVLNLPFFALPKWAYGIVWPILYLLIAYSIYLVYQEVKFTNKNYNTSLIANYIFNQLYIPLFFCLKSPMLGLIVSIGIFITSLFLYLETKAISKKSSKFLIPYIIFMGYATILSLAIYFLNL